jgi:hypothetical protein
VAFCVGFITSYRVLDSTDISTGHVVVTIGGNYYGQASIVTFVGAPTIREIAWAGANCSPTGTSFNLSTTSAPVAGDTAIYFNSYRADSVNPTCTVSRGTSLQSGTSLSFCGAIYDEILASSGTNTASYISSQTGFPQINTVIVKAM